MYNAGKVLLILSILAFVIPATGCSSTDGLKKYNIVVEIDEDSLRAASINNIVPSIECDIIGITDTQVDEWENYPVDEYFKYNNARRRDASKKTFSFNNNDTSTKILESNDAVWTEWDNNRITKVVIITDLTKDASLTGINDSRRKILEVMKSSWVGNDLNIVIKASGIECKSASKPKKK